MNLPRRVWVGMAGGVWFLAGALLLLLGMHFIMSGVYIPGAGASTKGREQTALFLVMGGLFAGFLKGRLLLIRIASKMTARLLSSQGPCSFFEAYRKQDLLLTGAMMVLGGLLTFLPIPLEIRGFIDVTVGAALMNSAPFYFRSAFAKKT